MLRSDFCAELEPLSSATQPEIEPPNSAFQQRSLRFEQSVFRLIVVCGSWSADEKALDERRYMSDDDWKCYASEFANENMPFHKIPLV